ncbi:MAG: cell division protein FtsL [Lachnospiraceae bacterium]|nr:cell division protein FtsL [Lachnospiraceae bacterium]
MAQNRRTATPQRNRTTYRNTNRNSAYVYGNVAYDVNVQRQLEEEPRRKLSHETRKNRDKARHMSLGYVTFLLAAFCTCAVILINYVQLQSELTTRTEHIAELQSELNTKKLSNDEAYNRITRNVDLEEIKRIAIGELGMTYAEQGQIIVYSNVGNDYMRKVNQGN